MRQQLHQDDMLNCGPELAIEVTMQQHCSISLVRKGIPGLCTLLHKYSSRMGLAYMAAIMHSHTQ
jgi:hypothetical protein